MITDTNVGYWHGLQPVVEFEVEKPYPWEETMSEKNIKVPEGMMKASYDAHLLLGKMGAQIPTVLEAALRWLSENPIVPTPEQARELIGPMVVLNETSLIFAIEAWQRRMFLAPETEVPGLDDVLESFISYMKTSKPPTLAEVEAKLEAYRRGQRSK